LADSAADRYRKAIEHAEGIKQAAVDELKKNINAQIAELNTFGFDFRLTQTGTTRPRKRAASNKEKFCKICNLSGHDARNHRNQDPQKKFTKAELEQRGLPTA